MSSWRKAPDQVLRKGVGVLGVMQLKWLPVPSAPSVWVGGGGIHPRVGSRKGLDRVQKVGPFFLVFGCRKVCWKEKRGKGKETYSWGGISGGRKLSRGLSRGDQVAWGTGGKG